MADLTLAMQVLTEGDGRQPVRPELVSLKGMRIGVYTDDGVLAASPAIRRAVEEAAEALRGLGAAGLDALLCPPMAIPAVTHGGFLKTSGIEASYETLFNVTGLPAGVQVAGRPWREDLVLAVMAALEATFVDRPDCPVTPVSL